jgi:hypothetical protein
MYTNIAWAAVYTCNNDLWTDMANAYADVKHLKRDSFGGYSLPPEFPAYPAPCNPKVAGLVAPQPNYATSNVGARDIASTTWSPTYSVGINWGIFFAANNPIRSSSGFYTDGNNSGGAGAGGLIGGSFFYNGWRLGSGQGPFNAYTVSLGMVVDYFGGASQDLTGRCGGTPCDGQIKINQLNFIPEIKLTTPFTQDLTGNIYYGWGLARVSPEGQPTGVGGPRIIGSDTAMAFRVGGGLSQRVTNNVWWDTKVGYQWTRPTEFSTSLANERFQFGVRGDFYAATGFTYVIDRAQRAFFP